MPETSVSEDNVDIEDVVLDSTTGNDTNKANLMYFSCMTNHYLRLVRSTNKSDSSRPHMQYPIIADSGANFHMFREREFFTSLSSATGHVILGDGKTKLQIKGIGTVSCTIGDQLLTINNVRYVPDLAESMYSLFLQIQFPSHSLYSSHDEG